MARQKLLDESGEQQQENRANGGVKGVQQNKKNHLGTSPPRSGSVLGLLHHRGRNGSNAKVQGSNAALPMTAEESMYCILKQLSNDGLTIREMPGDGNCLFRALSDQLEGNTHNHLHHRRAVVHYMRDNRPDFEPFVEDDQPFEKYVQMLSQPGTFAGNDAIVAFSRLHNVTVVIHQLNSPAWLIHPNSDGHVSSRREIHIAYHNGDHYSSVRKIGDNSDAPSNIRFIGSDYAQNDTSTKSKHPACTLPPSTVTSESSRAAHANPTDEMIYGRRDEDYWVKDTGDIDRLVDEVMQSTFYPDATFVRETLIEFNFDMVSTVDFIFSMSYIMSQSHTEKPTQSSIQAGSDSLPHTDEVDAVALENCSILNQPGSESTANEIPPKTETSENYSKLPVPIGEDSTGSTVQASPSLDKEDGEETDLPNTTDRKPRLSCRQKKDVKRREREAERRKKDDDDDSSTTPSAQKNSLRSLNI